MRIYAEKNWDQTTEKHGAHPSTFHGSLMLVPWARY